MAELLLTEHQAAAEDLILTEIHNSFDKSGVSGEEYPELALDLLGSILSKLIESGHITAEK